MKRTECVIGGRRIPVLTVNTVVVGAGAAGTSCALHLVDFFKQMGVEDAQERIVVITHAKGGGASRLSGSDKQTYYKMGTSPHVPDTALDFANTLTAFGCMHGDVALAEGCGSLRQFYRLVDAGVPFPHDAEGAFLGYKTDHDPYERATSAGPKTSRFMSECLEARLNHAGAPIHNRLEIVRLLRGEAGGHERIVGALAMNISGNQDSDLGLSVYLAENIVLAAGGPGEMYRITVYPHRQTGIHGIAFRAGLAAHNMTESQYGLASIKFRWNVSGTYMQVVPRIFSTATDGRSDPREFLTEYFPTMESMAANIFLKGYQWPFDAQRISDNQSTMVDMAVHRETVQRGRRVFMDFLRNPVGAEGMNAFAIENLGPEARLYLERTGALQKLPIERLAHMNQPAIDIYAEHKIDLHSEPLEIAVCAQHQNGGFIVNKWWESTIPHTFIIGEMAGTHGVKRPGGSALNAGQAGAVRSAEYIANVYGPDIPEPDQRLTESVREQIDALMGNLERMRTSPHAGAAAPQEAIDEIRDRMTRHAAHLRGSQTIGAARREAETQFQRIKEVGFRVENRKELVEAIVAESMALTQLAFLRALEDYIQRGGGSRGSYVILDPEGVPMPECLKDPETGQAPRWRPENEALRKTIQEIRFAPEQEGLFQIDHGPVRPIPDKDIAFEPAWRAYREKKIFRE